MDKVISEALRYLGYRKNRVPQQDADEVAAVMEQVRKQISPKCAYSLWDIEVGEGFVEMGGVHIESQSLRDHLRSAKRAVTFAATLGIGGDRLIKRLSGESMAKAVMANACASALIEEYCDQASSQIDAHGLFQLPRFSPGYGDFSISHQPDMARLTDCARKIGLTVTDAMLLSPSKSVTAIIGLTEEEQCSASKCKDCAKADCPFRRE